MVAGLRPTTVGGKWRNSRRVCTQAHASPKHSKSIRDTLLGRPAQSCLSLLVEMTLEEVAKLFIFLWLFSYVAYFVHQGWKNWYFDHSWTHMGHSGVLPNWKGKKYINFFLSHQDLMWWWPLFFSFSVRKCFKMTNNWQKLAKCSIHISTPCECTWACAQAQRILNTSGDQTLQMLKIWGCSDIVWSHYGCMKKWDGRTNGQTNKWTDLKTDKCQIYIRIPHALLKMHHAYL